MQDKNFVVRFNDFIARFPEIELPITFTDELQLEFSRNNLPLTQQMIRQHIALFELEEADELTEYIACFKIPETEHFQGIVYWRAGLMDYRYVLITYDKKGNYIDSKTLAGTYVDGETITKSIATIDSDWTIHVVSGQQIDGMEYDPSRSTNVVLELLPDGGIVAEV